MRKSRWLLLILNFLAGAFLVSFGNGVSANAKTIKITFPKHVVAKHPATINTVNFGKTVGVLSDGVINVKVYPGEQLYKTNQGLRFLTQGTVQMMNPPNGHFASYSPLFELIEVPFVFKTNVDFYSFLYGKTGEKLLRSLQKSNMHGITFADEGPFVIATKNRLINSPSDFKGLKIRTSGHPVVEKALQLLGASTTRISLGEVYSAAQQGVINGVFTTITAYVNRHPYEVLPYATLWPGHAAYVWVASKSWWDGLNPFYRHLIDTTAKESALKYDHQVWSIKDKYVNIIKKHGGKYHELSASQLDKIHAKIKPLYSDLKKKFGAKIIDEMMR